MESPLSRYKARLVGGILALGLALGCGRQEGSSPEEGSESLPSGGSFAVTQTYQLCSTSFSRRKIMDTFNGNLVFVSENKEKGSSAAEIVGNLVATILVNGLDTSKTYSYSFSNGEYTYSNGSSAYKFTLTFAEDFGSFKAGDTIPYNVFDYTSFIKNVSVTLLPSVSYSYEQGPLFDLISGSIAMDGKSLSGLKVSFKFAAEKMKFSFSSQGIYYGQSPRTKDTIDMTMTTTSALLSNAAGQFESGGYGVSYLATYTSYYYDLLQEISNTTFYIKKDATGYYWEGNYDAKITKGTTTMYQRGLVSSRLQNYADYYCDEARTDKLGQALHDLNLQGGTFTFQDGRTFRYGLQEF